jgi:hypothetical protein
LIGLERVVGDPVICNIDAPGNPHLVMRHDMIKEFDQSGKPRWPPNQTAMQPN